MSGSEYPRQASLVGCAVALLLLGATGCAYFNTFYFAKKYYAEAERSRKKTESDKLPPDAEKRYDDTIKQCRKVVNDHPGSRWADDAVFLMGASFYGKRDYDKALDTFDDLLRGFERSKFAASAHYMKGLCYFERREYAEMQRSFDEALRIEPRFERKDDILFTSAMAAERERNRPEAVRRYRELVQAYRGSERGDEGLLHIGDLYFEATRYDSAGLAYEELGRMTRNDTFFRESQIKLAETWVRRQNSETAIELLKPLLPKDEKQNRTADDFPARVRLLWARADNDIGRHEEALARLRGAVELYPASNFATEAQFQVGYTYEVYLDSLESARKAYDQAAKMSAKSVFREQAQIRLNNLNALQDLRSRISETGNTDREQQATAALKIAELFLFAQDENDEALAKYREVVRDYGDTKAAPRAAYGAAWMRLKRYEGARDSALSEFAGVIRTYPASQQARSALEILAAEGADTVGLGGLLEEVRPDTLAALPSLPEPPDTSRAGVSASPLEGDSLATGDEELDDIRRRGARSRDPRATQLSPILDPAKHDSIAAARAAQRRGARPPGPGTVAPDSLVNPDRVVTPGEVPPDSSKVPGGEP